MSRNLLRALVVSLALFAQGAAAQTIAYPGCRLAWDYSPEQAPLVSNFAVAMGDSKVILRPPATARSVLCSELPLKAGTNTVQVRAYSSSLAATSNWATLTFTYSITPPVQLPAPGGFTTKF